MHRNKALAILVAGLLFVVSQGLPTERVIAQTGAKLYYLKPKLFAPRPIEVKDIDGKRPVWFFKYQITNNADTEVFFVPRITVTTEDGVVNRDRFDPLALKAIENLYGKKYPSGLKAARKLKPGETVEAVALFPDIPKDADKLWIRIGGLTNEYYLTNPEAKDPKPVFRVYQKFYHRPGDDTQRALDPMLEGAQEWVWENTSPAKDEKK